MCTNWCYVHIGNICYITREIALYKNISRDEHEFALGLKCPFYCNYIFFISIMFQRQVSLNTTCDRLSILHIGKLNTRVWEKSLGGPFVVCSRRHSIKTRPIKL